MSVTFSLLIDRPFRPGQVCAALLAGEHGGFLGKEVDEFCLTALDVALCNLECVDAFEHIEQSGLVDAVELFGGILAEEYR